MTDAHPSRKGGGVRPLSPEARAEIADRRAAAIPNYLADIALLLRSRHGQADTAQLRTLAALLRVHTPADQLGDHLSRWISESGGLPPGNVGLIAALAADEPPSRRDLVAAWQPTADEETQLSLTHIVSEARRSALRRAAQSVPSPVTTPAPAEAPSAARSSRRRAASAAEAAAVAAVYAAAGVAPTTRRGGKPWEGVGVSRATYYRMRQAGETDGVRRADPTAQPSQEYPRLPISILYKYRVGLPDTDCLTPPPPSVCPHEEGRRLIAAAARHGWRWLGIDWRDPYSWYARPADPAQADLWYHLVGAACVGARRSDGIAEGRARRAALASPDGGTTAHSVTPAADDPAARPHRVSDAVWSAVLAVVPADRLDRLRGLAGRYWLDGLPPDTAVAAAIEHAVREAAIVARVRGARPGADINRVQRLADEHVPLSTADAASAVIAAIDAEDARRAAAVAAVEQAAAGIHLPAGLRAAILASAVDAMLWEDPPAASRAIEDARQLHLRGA